MRKINLGLFLIFYIPYSSFCMNQIQVEASAFSLDTLRRSSSDFFYAMIKFIHEHNSQTISFGSKRNLRSVSKQFHQLYDSDTNIQKLISFYNNRLDPTCFLLDRIYRGTVQEVEDSLTQIGEIEPKLSFCVSYYYTKYNILSASLVAHHRNDIEIVKLIKNKEFDPTQTEDNNLNIDLCMAACIGDIQKFEDCYSKGDKEHNQNSIPLAIWAATKNCDIKFLNHLKKHEEYEQYMLTASDKFLRQVLIGDYDWNRMPTSPLRHFQKVKKLIKSNCFSLLTRNHDCQFTWNQRAMDYFRDIYRNHKNTICGQYLKMIHWLTAEQYCKNVNIDIELYIEDNRSAYEEADTLGELEEDIFRNLHREESIVTQENITSKVVIAHLWLEAIVVISIFLLASYLKYYYKNT